MNANSNERFITILRSGPALNYISKSKNSNRKSQIAKSLLSHFVLNSIYVNISISKEFPQLSLNSEEFHPLNSSKTF